MRSDLDDWSMNQQFKIDLAVLKYNENEGKAILENISKTYGTLLLIKGNIKMKNKNLYLQIGNLFIIVNLIPRELIQ